jgi:hypothetical protein
MKGTTHTEKNEAGGLTTGNSESCLLRHLLKGILLGVFYYDYDRSR